MFCVFGQGFVSSDADQRPLTWGNLLFPLKKIMFAALLTAFSCNVLGNIYYFTVYCYRIKKKVWLIYLYILISSATVIVEIKGMPRTLNILKSCQFHVWVPVRTMCFASNFYIQEMNTAVLRTSLAHLHCVFLHIIYNM